MLEAMIGNVLGTVMVDVLVAVEEIVEGRDG